MIMIITAIRRLPNKTDRTSCYHHHHHSVLLTPNHRTQHTTAQQHPSHIFSQAVFLSPYPPVLLLLHTTCHVSDNPLPKKKNALAKYFHFNLCQITEVAIYSISTWCDPRKRTGSWFFLFEGVQYLYSLIPYHLAFFSECLSKELEGNVEFRR